MHMDNYLNDNQFDRFSKDFTESTLKGQDCCEDYQFGLGGVDLAQINMQ